MTDDLTGLLSKGIDLLAKGRTVEECMGQVDTTSLSSAEREELHELLDTAASLLPLRQLAVPPPRSKAASRARLLSEAVQQREKGRRQAVLGGLRVPPRLRRGLLGVALSLALLLMVGSGAVSAAVGSLPGSPLYPLKLAVEDARLTLTFSSPARTQLYMRFASERTAEMVRLAAAGRPVSETVVARMARQLQGALHAAEAVGCPVVALFGPTSPRFGYSPHLQDSQLVTSATACSPCSKNGSRPCHRPVAAACTGGTGLAARQGGAAAQPGW